jgi:hypothetical protein
MINASTASAAISVYDGNGQSAPVGGAYGAPLKALVRISMATRPQEHR